MLETTFPRWFRLRWSACASAGAQQQQQQQQAAASVCWCVCAESMLTCACGCLPCSQCALRAPRRARACNRERRCVHRAPRGCLPERSRRRVPCVCPWVLEGAAENDVRVLLLLLCVCVCVCVCVCARACGGGCCWCSRGAIDLAHGRTRTPGTPVKNSRPSMGSTTYFKFGQRCARTFVCCACPLVRSFDQSIDHLCRRATGRCGVLRPARWRARGVSPNERGAACDHSRCVVPAPRGVVVDGRELAGVRGADRSAHTRRHARRIPAKFRARMAPRVGHGV